ncbi:MAG: hypothetical protein CO093_02130 [Alphaproteobacteria bacterium CG_4_9_14_3_um_filter_47_13]|nr:MAG: hypothetical protein CO093_02130 [Alphaproteobacteria bacterium CG_4_9_14_3_um_filter_47_13]
MAFLYEWVNMQLMRNIVLGFLTILMLMPSLACAMPSCVSGAKAEASTNQPCADHHPGHEGSKKETGKVNLLLDCMGVDMQKADTASIDKPNLKTDFVVYALVTEIVADQLAHTDAGTIRGPPSTANAMSPSRPLYLTTQRFRI